MNEQKVSNMYWGLLLAVFGGVMLAKNLEYIKIDIAWDTHWPIALIVVGGAMIIRTFTARKRD